MEKGAQVVCVSEDPEHRYPREGDIICFAPQFDIGKYNNKFATQYAGLWAYGYQILHLGENESVYRTVLDLASEVLLHQTSPMVLDLGCGVGRVARDLAQRFPSGEIIGLDGSISMLHIASRFVVSSTEKKLDLSEIGYGTSLQFHGAGLTNVMLLQGDATRTPFQDGIFRLITAVNLIDRVANPRHVFNEIFRLLSPGGQCILTSPLNWDRSAIWQDLPDRDAVLDEIRKSGIEINEWFDGLRYREYLDSRGNFTEWNTLVITGTK